MPEEEIPTLTLNDVPDPVQELRNMIKEQQAIILKQNEAIKSLTVRMNESEKLSAAAPAEQVQAAAPVKEDPQEAAYKAMLKELGIKEE